MKQKVFVGIGSNIGGSSNNCITSIKKLSEDKRTKLIAVSSLYATSPVSAIEQEDFVNCAACIMWKDSPFELLRLLNHIEEAMGRKRDTKGGPRIIDLDILLFGDLILDDPVLQIPHPEMHKRRFALVPCIEIDPNLEHPLFKRRLSEFLAGIGDEQKITVLESVSH